MDSKELGLLHQIIDRLASIDKLAECVEHLEFEIKYTQTEFKSDIKELRDELKADIKDVKDRLTGVEGRLTGVEDRLSGVETEVRKTNMHVENEVWAGIGALKDGHSLILDKINNLESKTEDIESAVEVLKILQHLKVPKNTE